MRGKTGVLKFQGCKCKQKGHFISNCPMIKCYKCKKYGHYSKDCLNEQECSKCHEKGHKKEDCFAI